MANETIPMSGNLAQTDSRIPLTVGSAPSVKPFEPVDVQQEQARSYTLQGVTGDAKSKVEDQADADRDKTNLRAYLASGGPGDMNTPEGIRTILDSDWSKKNLSPKGYENISKLYGDKMTAHLNLQKQLTEMDPDSISNVQRNIEFQAQYITAPPLNAYNQIKANGGGEQEAQAAFRTARSASVELAKNLKNPDGSPMFSPNKIQAMAAATPEEFQHVMDTSTYHANQLKTAAELRAKEAGIKESEAKAKEAEAKAIEALAIAKRGGPGSNKQQVKTMLIDGEPHEVLFNPSDGTFKDANTGADVSSKVKPIEKGDLTAVQKKTVHNDLFEIQKFLKSTPVTGTTSPFFMDQTPDEGFATRWTKNKLKPAEQQQYDVYANRVANAIVGIQSLGRYRGAVKSIDEARKLVPAPGDLPSTVRAKRAYMEDFARQVQEDLNNPAGAKTHIMPEQRITPEAPPMKGSPDAAKAGSPATPTGIPEGSKLVGHTPEGKEVWQSTDGKKWVP